MVLWYRWGRDTGTVVFLGSSLFMILLFCSVVYQEYSSEVMSEYVIKGNNALIKCSIPSYVADFVSVSAWVASDGTSFVTQPNYGN